MLDCLKNKSFLVCIIIFAAGVVLSALEMIAYGTNDVLNSFLIIMLVINFILFGGIIAACAYRNKRILKILIVLLLAWDGIVYLTQVIPMVCGYIDFNAEAWAFSLANIVTLAALIVVVLGALMYLLGLLLGKNLNKYVVILYLVATVLGFIAFVFNIIFVVSTDAMYWGQIVESLLKTVIYLGTAVGVYIFSKKDEPAKVLAQNATSGTVKQDMSETSEPAQNNDEQTSKAQE